MLKAREEIQMMSDDEKREYIRTRTMDENIEMAKEFGYRQGLIDMFRAKFTDEDTIKRNLIEETSKIIGSENITQEVLDYATKVATITVNLYKNVDFEQFIDMTPDEREQLMSEIAEESGRIAEMV